MCDLPIERLGVLDFVPFKYVSLDFCGPVHANIPPEVDMRKFYILVYTCQQTRALYLCLNQSMTTWSFLQSLRQITARVGHPALILSDNQTSFKAADRVLKRLLKNLNWNSIKNYSKQNNSHWIYSTELSPWKNGLSERLCGLTKRSLRIVLKNTKVDYFELVALLAELPVGTSADWKMENFV